MLLEFKNAKHIEKDVVYKYLVSNSIPQTNIYGKDLNGVPLNIRVRFSLFGGRL